MATFLLSLATDLGPVGAQVSTFIKGDDVAETLRSLRERIEGLKIPSECEHRHAYGREMEAHLHFIVESIEQLVLPTDPDGAFGLLVAMFEADAIAMENCGEHHWGVACAYQCAADLMSRTIKQLPAAAVKERLQALLAPDAYGVRAALKSIQLNLPPS